MNYDENSLFDAYINVINRRSAAANASAFIRVSKRLFPGQAMDSNGMLVYVCRKVMFFQKIMLDFACFFVSSNAVAKSMSE